MEEQHLLLPPCCFAKGCDQSFEGHVPESWMGMDISFVATLYDSARRPTKLLPMRISTFFCPEHAAKVAQMEDLSDFVEATSQGGFTVSLDED